MLSLRGAPGVGLTHTVITFREYFSLYSLWLADAGCNPVRIKRSSNAIVFDM